MPRTFIGPLVVSAAAYPLVWLASTLGASKFVAQFIGESNSATYYLQVRKAYLQYNVILLQEKTLIELKLAYCAHG